MGIGDDEMMFTGISIPDDCWQSVWYLRVFEMADFHVLEDDQAVLTDFMAVPLDEMILDYNQAIAGKNRHSRSGCMREDLTEEERFIHGTETGITLLFTHSTDGLTFWHEGLWLSGWYGNNVVVALPGRWSWWWWWCQSGEDSAAVAAAMVWLWRRDSTSGLGWLKWW